MIISVLFSLINALYALPFTHYTSDYLRLRKDANLNSEIITVLEPNLGVEIIEYDKKATIDGITADWVKVQCANGYNGWCFSGYLFPIEANVSDKLAKEIENIEAGSYPNKNYDAFKLSDIKSISELKGKDGYYIQQQSRRFQGSGRAPEILQLVIINDKIFVREIDIVQNKVVTLKEIEFEYNGKTFAHDKSKIKLDDKNQIQIFYFENIPKEDWLGTYEYKEPYTRVSNINSAQLVKQTSDVLKNYAGVYKFDSFKVIKSENSDISNARMESITKVKIDIYYNKAKKCLSVGCHDLIDINSPNNVVKNWTLDFIETSVFEPFFWTYGEGTGYSEEKFWFYKGGIAISFESKGYDFDDDYNIKAEKFIKYVIFLKKEK